MASIIKRPEGHRWIQVVDPKGKRWTIRLGKITAKAAAEVCRRIEILVAAKISGTTIDAETAQWLGSIGGNLRERLSVIGLAERPEREAECPRLAKFIDDYIAGRKDVEDGTRTVLRQTRRCLVTYFGQDKPLNKITPADAENWRVWMATEANTCDGQDGLSENTIRRHSGRARQFFGSAIRQGLLEKNPFRGLPTTVRGNRARQRFISRENIQAVIDAAPDVEWRLIIALARYGGLRIPSELLSLVWSEVDWEAGTFVIHSKKTERYANAGIRVCPIFPELRPFLEAAREAAEPGAKYIISRYRKSNANLRTQFMRIIKRAGLEPWPKLFHNLRSTRQTELLDNHPPKAVCDWMGNSEKVAKEHYAQVTIDHIRKAATTPTGPVPILPCRIGAAESEAVAKQNAQQHTAALDGMVTQAVGEMVKNPEKLQVCASTCRSLLESKMTPTGLEPVLPA